MIQQDRYYPRTFRINGDALHQGTATAILISSLFAGWPKDRLAQLYSSRCDRPQMTSAKRMATGRTQRQDSGYRRTSGNEASYVQSSSALADGQTKKRIRGIIRTVMDLVPYRLSPELLRDIDAFRPEVIYSSIGNIQLASLVKNLARRENAATVVHLLDDWIATKHANSWAEAWPRRELLRISRDLITIVRKSERLVLWRRVTDRLKCRSTRSYTVGRPGRAATSGDVKPGEVLRLLYLGGYAPEPMPCLAGLLPVHWRCSFAGELSCEAPIYAPAIACKALHRFRWSPGIRVGAARSSRLRSSVGGSSAGTAT